MATHPLQKLHRAGKLHPFGVTINQVSTRHYCPKHVDGMGYLYADRCSDCRLVPSGWEAWGSNGHMQGSGRDRASMLHWLKCKAYQAHPAPHEHGPGHYWRMVFKRGGRIIYLG